MNLCTLCQGNGDTHIMSLVVISATDKAGATSLMDQLTLEYDPEADALHQENLAPLVSSRDRSLSHKPPLPTLRPFEEHSIMISLGSVGTSAAASPPTTNAVTDDASPPRSTTSNKQRTALQPPKPTMELRLSDIGRSLRSAFLTTASRKSSIMSSAASSSTQRASLSAAVDSASDKFFDITSLLSSSTSGGYSSCSSQGAIQYHKVSLLKKISTCDAVVFVVNSADREPIQESNALKSPSLSDWQVQMFLGIRRCLAEMVDGGGMSAEMLIMDSADDVFPSGAPSSGSRKLQKRFKRSSYPLIEIVANQQDKRCALAPRDVARSLGLDPGCDHTSLPVDDALLSGEGREGSLHRDAQAAADSSRLDCLQPSSRKRVTEPFDWVVLPCVASNEKLCCSGVVEAVAEYMVHRKPLRDEETKSRRKNMGGSKSTSSSKRHKEAAATTMSVDNAASPHSYGTETHAAYTSSDTEGLTARLSEWQSSSGLNATSEGK